MKEAGLLEDLGMKEEGLTDIMKQAGYHEDIKTNKTFHFSHNTIAATTLLEEMNKGEASQWFPYLINLPMGSGIRDYPICYTQEELDYLQGSMCMLDLIDDWKRDMREDYDKICQLVPEMGKYDFPEFRNAEIMSQSRSFGLPLGNDEFI